MPEAIMLGTATFTISAMPGTPSIQNAISMPFFGAAPFAAPGLGVIPSLIMLGFGLRWLEGRAAAAKARGEGFGDGAPPTAEALAQRGGRDAALGSNHAAAYKDVFIVAIVGAIVALALVVVLGSLGGSF
jgi:H+/gluconate symporter-like permease